MTLDELIDALNRLKENNNKLGKLPVKVEYDNYGEIVQQDIDDVSHQNHIMITGKSNNTTVEYILLSIEDNPW